MNQLRKFAPSTVFFSLLYIGDVDSLQSLKIIILKNSKRLGNRWETLITVMYITSSRNFNLFILGVCLQMIDIYNTSNSAVASLAAKIGAYVADVSHSHANSPESDQKWVFSIWTPLLSASIMIPIQDFDSYRNLGND